jgi:S1-C subfamily serine protease
MHQFLVQVVVALILLAPAAAQSPRFVVDDDEYVDKITAASSKLLEKGKLKLIDSFRKEVSLKGFSLKSAKLSHEKLAPEDLCERLRESTLAVGSYYKCPDCGDWHFNSSAGFVIGEGGIISTCCHVVVTEDEGVKESYLIAADAEGRVFPIQSVVAADLESDTCFLKINAAGLKPLPLRAGVRPGERVYCLSHPGGYHFMFTQGMVARVNRKREEMLDNYGQTNGLMTRPLLFLNITAEFAPGSSGAPIVDEAGNVVAQVSSIAEAGESPSGDENGPASPSVPVRFCLAAEEILRLTDTHLKKDEGIADARPKVKSPHGAVGLKPAEPRK